MMVKCSSFRVSYFPIWPWKQRLCNDAFLVYRRSQVSMFILLLCCRAWLLPCPVKQKLDFHGKNYRPFLRSSKGYLPWQCFPSEWNLWAYCLRKAFRFRCLLNSLFREIVLNWKSLPWFVLCVQPPAKNKSFLSWLWFGDIGPGSAADLLKDPSRDLLLGAPFHTQASLFPFQTPHSGQQAWAPPLELPSSNSTPEKACQKSALLGVA